VCFYQALLNDLQNFLESDSLQFGFKKKSSCSHAMALRSVVEHYCKSGSTVTVCALDISKAYDREWISMHYTESVDGEKCAEIFCKHYAQLVRKGLRLC